MDDDLPGAVNAAYYPIAHTKRYATLAAKNGQPEVRVRTGILTWRPALWALSWLCFSQVALGAEVVWIEGENPTSTTFNNHSWYCCSDVRTHLLSPGSDNDPTVPGAWLSHFNSAGGTASATYDFTLTEGGAYDIWIRTSSYMMLLTMALDGGAPIHVDTDNHTREHINLNWPGIDVRFLGWVRMANIPLDVGAHTLSFEVGEHENYGGVTHGGIDAINIVNFDWGPSGAVPPDTDAPTPSADEWFAFTPGDPPPPGDSVFDLSAAIEAPAGGHGPLQTDGADFSFSDGSPIKFWGVGSTYPGTPELAAQQAQMYRMFGINMVRLHPVQSMIGILHTDESTGERTIDAEALDALDIWFAALKEAGIYMTFSSFFPHVVTEEDGIPPDIYSELSDRGEGKTAYGYVTFVEELQAAEWTWMAALLDHTNPYTGIRYADDPSLAILEIRNEDSVFWHSPLNTLWDGSLPNLQGRLQHMWMEWLQDRYADDPALAEAWGEGLLPGDALDNASMAVYGAWEMAADGPWSGLQEAARMGDYIRFLAETQADGYIRRADLIRGAGFEGVIVSTAWMAGGPSAGAANLWSDIHMQAIDRHTYAGGMSEPSHSIQLAAVNQASHLDAPGSALMGVGWWQVEDKPFLNTEWTMSAPTWWKAEAAPLYAYYGMGLHGWDASYHFTASKAWLRGGWPGQAAYVSETPHYMGQFPALARAVHEGHLLESDPVAARRLSLDDAFTGFDMLTQAFTGGGWDAAAGENTLEVPGEAFAVGKITLDVGEDLGPSERMDWASFIDDEGVIHSATGQHRWDTANRVVHVDSPSSQGIIGFAGGQVHDLSDFEVAVETGFVSLLFTALDGRPLSHSGRVLITAMARDRQLGAVYSEDGSELIEMGGPPLLLEPVQATITVKRAAETEGAVLGVTPLDEYGVPTDASVPLTEATFTIDGTYAASHYLLELVAIDEEADTGDGGGGGDGAGTTEAPGADPDLKATLDEEEKGGCGCSSTRSAHGWWPLLALLPLLVRRRRT